MKKEILHKLKEIKLFLFDLDGVLLLTGSLNEENSKIEFLDTIDKAVKEFRRRGIAFGISTARSNDDVVESLAKIEGCNVLSSSIEKVTAVNELAAKMNISFDKIFYMGDEVLDIPLLRKCGLSAAPSTAKREVKRVVSFTLIYSRPAEVFHRLFSSLDQKID